MVSFGLHRFFYTTSRYSTCGAAAGAAPYRRMMEMGCPLAMLMVCETQQAVENCLSLAGDLPMLAVSMEMALQGPLTGADTVWRSPAGSKVR